jgi:hypothetical protein
VDDPLTVYLHDHLAGAALAVDLLGAMRDKHPADPLGSFAAALLKEVEEDRAVLRKLADRFGPSGSGLKEVTAWLAEKASRFKLDRGAQDLGTFEALEFLVLGVSGKLLLWKALAAVASSDKRLQGVDFERLTGRAQAQRDKVEEQRLRLALTALLPPPKTKAA